MDEQRKKKKKERRKKRGGWGLDEGSDHQVHETYAKMEPVKK